MNLLPFNLEQALKDPARVVYRNGDKPLEWHWFESCTTPFPICLTNSSGRLVSYTKDGLLHLNEENYLDLMLLPLPEKTHWVNVYENDVSDPYLFTSISVYECEEDAIAMIDKDLIYIKTISFTI